jgi:hypothetical protein
MKWACQMIFIASVPSEQCRWDLVCLVTGLQVFSDGIEDI